MPNHKINLDIAKLDAEYEQMMDDVYLLHHTYPTNLKHMSQTDADLAAQGEADAYARGARKPGRNSKKVIFENDPDYCNGMPRRKR